MVGVGDIDRLAGGPAPQPPAGSVMPGERSGGHRRLGVVHPYGAVGRGAPEEVAPAAIRRVAVGAGVHEVWLPERGALDPEKVRVPVAGPGRAAERTHVEDQL